MWTTIEPEYPSGATGDLNTTKLSEIFVCPDLHQFGMFYKRIHGYTSLTVCSFGIVANVLSLIVLTRRDMATSTNLILSGLAFADMLNMVEYIPFVIYTDFLLDPVNGKPQKSWAWASYVLFHSNFSQICHTTAIWLTLTLSIWRYIMLTRPFESKHLCSMIRAKWAILMAYSISPVLCIPMFCSFSMRPIEMENAWNTYNLTEGLSPNQQAVKTRYVVAFSNLVISNPRLKKANFWFFGIVIKLLPCLILTIVSFQLIRSLRAAKKRKDQLLGANGHFQMAVRHDPFVSSVEPKSSASSTRDISGTKRTTRMLVATLVLFLISEFPQGVLALLSDLLGEQFFIDCYIPLADLMDFVAILSSAINLILYCMMGKQYRDMFCKVFRTKRFLRGH